MDIDDSDSSCELDTSHITRSVYEGDVDSLLLEPLDKDFKNNYEFYDLNCETGMLVLTKPCKLYFYGSVAVRSLAGRAEILGYITDPSKPQVQIYSSEGSSALYISTTDWLEEHSDVDISEISNLGVSLMEATKICNTVRCGGCILLLEEVERKRHSSKKSVRRVRRFGLSLDSQYQRIRNKVIIPPTLRLDINSGITVVCGGKGVGKSTSLRYLVNRTLNYANSLLYLDLDIGQPEFTLHECVSAILVDRPLVGPSYTHFKKPSISFNVGNIDASRCVDTYLRAVELLVKECRASYSHIPWLINTMGFSKGVGVFITSSCLSIIKPSLVIQIDGPKSNNFPFDLTSCNVEAKSGHSVPDYNFVKVLKEFKGVKDSAHGSILSNKEMRWIATQNYFDDELRPSYPLSVPADYLHVFNVTNKSVISSDQYSHLVSKLVILSNSESLEQPPLSCDYGLILAYEESESVFIVLTPLEPHEALEVKSILVGSLQMPTNINKAVNPHTSGIIPYCHISQSGATTPTIKPLKRKYRFLFEPPSITGAKTVSVEMANSNNN